MADQNVILIGGNVTWHKYYDPGTKLWTSMRVRLQLDEKLGNSTWIDIRVNGEKQINGRHLKSVLNHLETTTYKKLSVVGSYVQRKQADGTIIDSIRASITDVQPISDDFNSTINTVLLKGRVERIMPDNGVVYIQTSFFNPKKAKDGEDGWDRRLIPAVCREESIISPDINDVKQGQQAILVGHLHGTTPSGKEQLHVEPSMLTIF